MFRRVLAVATVFLLPAAGFAQTLTGAAVEPAEITAGESVNITANFSVEGNINCGLRIHFGDGTTVDYKINQQRDVPLVVPRTYGKPGDYKIMVENHRQGALLKCGGKNQVVALKVNAAAPPAVAAPRPAIAAAPAATAAGTSLCPDGWNLNKKSVNKKTGAFSCSAAPGTKPVKVACPGDLTYYENVRKGLLGCRP